MMMYGATKVEKRAGKIEHDPGYIVHTVEASDTLQKLAVKYSVLKDDIKRENSLWRDEDIHGRKTVVIPKDKTSHRVEERELKNQKQFCLEGFAKATECDDQEECLKYLEDNCWNVTKAVQAYNLKQQKSKNVEKFLEENPNWLDKNDTFDQNDRLSVHSRVKARGGFGSENGVTPKEEDFIDAIRNSFTELRNSFTIEKFIF